MPAPHVRTCLVSAPTPSRLQQAVPAQSSSPQSRQMAGSSGKAAVARQQRDASSLYRSVKVAGSAHSGRGILRRPSSCAVSRGRSSGGSASRSAAAAALWTAKRVASSRLRHGSDCVRAPSEGPAAHAVEDEAEEAPPPGEEAGLLLLLSKGRLCHACMEYATVLSSRSRDVSSSSALVLPRLLSLSPPAHEAACARCRAAAVRQQPTPAAHGRTSATPTGRLPGRRSSPSLDKGGAARSEHGCAAPLAIARDGRLSLSRPGSLKAICEHAARSSMNHAEPS